MVKTLKLSDEDLNKLTQYESSIAHWANEHTVLVLKAKKMLEGIDNLYVARQKMLDEFIKASDIKPSEVESLSVAPNGEVTVVVKEVVS
jgi:hypothetical protein